MTSLLVKPTRNIDIFMIWFLKYFDLVSEALPNSNSHYTEDYVVSNFSCLPHCAYQNLLQKNHTISMTHKENEEAIKAQRINSTSFQYYLFNNITLC